MALSVTILIPGKLHAQVLYGSITGNVTDKSGSVVPTAKVDAVNVETGVPRQTLTDAMQSRNKSVASYDRTHNLILFGSYELPFGRGKRWLNHGFVNKLAGGWEINGIMARVSGAPFTVGSSGTSLNAPGNTQTANQVLPDVEILGGLTPYFNPKAFAAPIGVRFGNTGRNILRGPGYFNLDSSVFRNFRLTERARLQFRAEAFGVTNTPHFGNPAATVTNGGFGNITSASGQRQLRFALELNY